MADPIDEAIAATEQTVEMVTIPVTIGSTGRPVQLIIPRDITESELAELCGFMLTAMLGIARSIAADPMHGRIVHARKLPV